MRAKTTSTLTIVDINEGRKWYSIRRENQATNARWWFVSTSRTVPTRKEVAGGVTKVDANPATKIDLSIFLATALGNIFRVLSQDTKKTRITIPRILEAKVTKANRSGLTKCFGVCGLAK